MLNPCGEIVISDPNSYIQKLNAGLYDKLFFLNHIFDASLFFDYGCATGQLGYMLSQFLNDISYFGYDNNLEMIYKGISFDNSDYSIDRNKLLNTLRVQQYDEKKKSCLILSSVIHEIYSYNNKIDDFWNFVFESDFDYIVIRDMTFLSSFIKTEDYHLWEERVYEGIRLSPVNGHGPNLRTKYKDFKNHSGILYDYPNLIEFLLKYKYNENWDREVKEKYLPISYEMLKYIISLQKNYEIIHDEIFSPLFLKQQIERDFSLKNFNLNTHVKMILRKNNGDILDHKKSLVNFK